MRRKVNINVSIDRVLLYRLTEWAKRNDLNRSEAICYILQSYFDGGAIFC